MKKLVYLFFILIYALQINAASDSESTFAPTRKTLSRLYWESKPSEDDDLYNTNIYSAFDDPPTARKVIHTPWYPLPAPTTEDEARFFNYISKPSDPKKSEQLARMIYICPFCGRFGSNSRVDITEHFREKHGE